MKKKIAPTWNQTHEPRPLTVMNPNVPTTPPLRLAINIPLKIYEHQISMIKDLSLGLHMRGPPH